MWFGLAADKLLGWIPRIIIKMMRPYFEELFTEIARKETRPDMIAGLMREITVAMEEKDRGKGYSDEITFSATEAQNLNHLSLLLEEEGIDASVLDIRNRKPNEIFQWLNKAYPYAKEGMLEKICTKL